MKKTQFSLLIAALFVSVSAFAYDYNNYDNAGPDTPWGSIIFLGIFGIIAILALFSAVVIVKQQEVKMIERFGKFKRIATAGISFKVPFIDTIGPELSLRVLELEVVLETKTEDDVFVKMKTQVMYEVITGKEYEAAYKLTSAESQIDSYVNDILRAEVPSKKLDETFRNKEELSKAVKAELEESMNSYGYNIIKTLITDIDPDEVVKESMNAINAAERNKIAAGHRAAALIIERTGEGKAEAAFKRLQGKGMADQRKELAKGIKDSLGTIKAAGASQEDANTLMVMAQHYDTLQSLGANESNLILFDGSAGASMDQYQQMVTAFHSAENLKEKPSSKEKKTD